MLILWVRLECVISTCPRCHLRQSVLTSAADKLRANRLYTMCSCLSVNSAQLVGKEILNTSMLQKYSSSFRCEKTTIYS